MWQSSVDLLLMEIKMKIRNICIPLLLLAISGCSNINLEPPKSNSDMVWASHDERPEWVILPPKGTDSVKSFVGMSHQHASEKSAKQEAYTNAIAELIKHANQKATKNYTVQAQSTGLENETLNAQLNVTDVEKIQATGLLSNVSTEQVYIEQWERKEDLFFKAYILVSIPKEEYEKLFTP